jgi:sulfopyruvate decarboxylase TPP-binding subunit
MSRGDEMTAFMKGVDVARELSKELISADFGPFFGTPCPLLALLHTALQEQVGVLTVAREENAVGIAAGTSLAGRTPVVLMQNSGLGQTVNAVAALVVPYRIPMLLVVSVTEVKDDSVKETKIVGELTEPLLEGLGIEVVHLDPEQPVPAQVDVVSNVVQRRLRPCALLVPADTLGWRE